MKPSLRGFRLGCVFQSHAGTLASLGCSGWGLRMMKIQGVISSSFQKKSVSHTTFKRGFVSTSQACRRSWCKTCQVTTCDCKSLLRCPSWSWSYHSSRNSGEPVEAMVDTTRHFECFQYFVIIPTAPPYCTTRYGDLPPCLNLQLERLQNL